MGETSGLVCPLSVDWEKLSLVREVRLHMVVLFEPTNGRKRKNRLRYNGCLFPPCPWWHWKSDVGGSGCVSFFELEFPLRSAANEVEVFVVRTCGGDLCPCWRVFEIVSQECVVHMHTFSGLIGWSLISTSLPRTWFSIPRRTGKRSGRPADRLEPPGPVHVPLQARNLGGSGAVLGARHRHLLLQGA